MNKPILKYRLEKGEKAVVFQILEQDMVVLHDGLEIIDIFNLDIYCHPHNVKPHLNSNSINLRTTANIEYYDYISIICFATNKSRDEYYDKVQKTMQKLKERYTCKTKQEGSVFELWLKTKWYLYS